MQLLNTALASHALPPYDSLSDLQKMVLTAQGTRLRHLHSGLSTEPLDTAEIAAAVQDCAIVTSRLAHLDAALTENSLPASHLLTSVDVRVLMADPALAAVFRPEPIDDTQLVAIITLAVRRLVPTLRPAPSSPWLSAGSSDSSFSPIIC